MRENDHYLDIIRNHILHLTQLGEESLESSKDRTQVTIGRDHYFHHHFKVGIDLGKFLGTVYILESLDKIRCHMLRLVLMQNSGGKYNIGI